MRWIRLKWRRWKKVTTNVSGFITGSPIIDHYGDLVVSESSIPRMANGRCSPYSKPIIGPARPAPSPSSLAAGEAKMPSRSRAASPMPLADQYGTSLGVSLPGAKWTVCSRHSGWDSQLIARQAGSSAPLDVNTEFKPSQKEYLLLWRNSEKPKAPFNLTPFACTLVRFLIYSSNTTNDSTERHPEWSEAIPCSDRLSITHGPEGFRECRVRTSTRVRAFAPPCCLSDRNHRLKTLNEEMQRNTRKARAEGRLPPHEARWFSSSMDPDSGERLWEPKRTDTGEVLFWAEREKAGQEGQWEGIDHIFAE